MDVNEDVSGKVKCPMCGEYLEPPNPIKGVVWAVMGCDECNARHDEGARKLLGNADLLEGDGSS